MTNATPERTAKAILQEALDTIKATFWIKAAEFHWAYSEEEPLKCIAVTVGEGFDTSEENIDDEGKGRVTGVCSIGALALANVTLWESPLESWDTISTRDPLTYAAGAALVEAILDKEPYWALDYHTVGGLIAAWNDNDDTTREDVVDAFTRALESPLLAPENTELWGVDYQSNHSEEVRYPVNPLHFASEEAAQEFITKVQEAPVKDVNKEDVDLAQYVAITLSNYRSTMAPMVKREMLVRA